jgi:hypothetical protein
MAEIVAFPAARRRIPVELETLAGQTGTYPLSLDEILECLDYGSGNPVAPVLRDALRQCAPCPVSPELEFLARRRRVETVVEAMKRGGPSPPLEDIVLVSRFFNLSREKLRAQSAG